MQRVLSCRCVHSLPSFGIFTVYRYYHRVFVCHHPCITASLVNRAMNRKPGPSWQAKGSRRIEGGCLQVLRSPIYDYSSYRGRQNVNSSNRTYTVEILMFAPGTHARVRWDKPPQFYLLFYACPYFSPLTQRFKRALWDCIETIKKKTQKHDWA